MTMSSTGTPSGVSCGSFNAPFGARCFMTHEDTLLMHFVLDKS